MKTYEKNYKKSAKDESGMMVVEAVLTFTVFLMVVLAIISLINIFMVHNKVQFAINSTAHELAGYGYLYEVFGLADAEDAVEADGEKYTQPIEDAAVQLTDSFNKIQSLYGNATAAGNNIQNLTPEQIRQLMNEADETAGSVEKSVNDISNLLSDGDSLLVGFIYLGASMASDAVKSVGATAAAEALTEKYLRNGTQSADEYLRSFGVVDGYGGLDFSESTMFCDKERRMIDIVVEYDIDMSFVALVFPEQKVHVVQRVSVPAWLDGDGKKCNF